MSEFRDWSLITGRGGGGLQNRGGRHVKFYPSEKKVGGGEVLAMLKEGGRGVTKGFGVVFMQ